MFKKKKAVKIIGILLVAVVGVAIFIGASSNDAEEVMAEVDQTVQIAVDTITPSLGNIAVTGEYIGTVEPNQQVTVYAKLGGDVLTANYNVGDTVQAGAVLAQIDATTLQYTIAQTQATIASAEAKAQLGLEAAEYTLDSFVTGLEEGTNASLIEAEKGVETARTSVESASSTVRSARSAYREDRNDTTRNAVTQAESALETARLRLEMAEELLRAVKAGIVDGEYGNEVKVREAELSTDMSAQHIQLQSLQNDLSNATLTAPISGIIEQKNIDVYDMASTGTAAYVISNKDVMTISFQISEAAYAHVQMGDQVVVEKNGQTCVGAITEISTMVNSSTGLFTVKASVENPPFDLITGSSVKVYADTQKALNTVLIPIDAVYYENSKPYVYVARNGLAERVFIETGIYDTENIQILSSDLQMTDRIITSWSASLAEGVEVIVDDVQPAASAGAETTTEDAPDELAAAGDLASDGGEEETPDNPEGTDSLEQDNGGDDDLPEEGDNN